MPATPRAFAPRAYHQRAAKWLADANSSDCFKVESITDPRGAKHFPHSRIIHTRQSRVCQPDEAIGEFVMTRGEHRFVFEIKLAPHVIGTARASSASGILVGVASPDGHQRFGIRPSDGRAISIPAVEREQQAVMVGGSSRTERAVSQRIEVTVNMARRLVLYSIDGAPAVDSGVLPDDYPDSLVPWCSLFYKNDSVTLSHHQTRGVNYPTSPRSPPSSAGNRGTDSYFPAFEAGPWVP